MEYIKIGQLKKTHGVQGELKFFVEDHFWEDFNEADAFFVEQAGQKVPYFVEYIRGKHGYIIKFEDVDDKKQAAALANQSFFLRAEDVSAVEEVDATAYGHCVGYSLHDKTEGEIGEVLRIEDYPQQEMAVVAYQEKEVLVPLQEAWIVAIDEAQQVLKMDLPAGLLMLS